MHILKFSQFVSGSKHRRTMERDSEQIPSQVELSAVSWGSRWEVREDPMSTQWWITVLQLLWFSQHCTLCSCWCHLQISVLWGWSTGKGWGRNNLERFKPEKRFGVGEWQNEHATDKYFHSQPHCCRLSVLNEYMLFCRKQTRGAVLLELVLVSC